MLVLLDDCSSSATNPSSRLLTKPVRRWEARTPDEIPLTLQAIAHAQRDGLTVIALMAYELGEHLQEIKLRQPLVPLIEAFAFEEFKRLSAEALLKWMNAELRQRDALDQPCGVIDITCGITRDRHATDIAAIQGRIAAGETYQVNHTFKFQGAVFGDPLALYATLRKRQPVRYGAYIETGSRKILSLSPELFLQSADGVITAKPMKGTRKADQMNAEKLAQSAKDRAENLMITDLIRNDLGRICETGSVAVPKLFEVEQVGDVYQMTSTVTGKLKKSVNLADLLAATFPCGSITGAPKRHTMNIIQTIEPQPRNLYCGSIACIDPDGSIQMNVAIRTLELDTHGRFEMGVGSGITADSNAGDEWDECMTKAAFVTSLPSPVGLIETMRAEKGRIALLPEHMQRLERSAQALGISCDISNIKNQVASVLGTLSGMPHMVRLELATNGGASLSTAAFTDIAKPQMALWASDLLGTQKATLSSKNPLLAHKTTARAFYDAGWKAAVNRGGFDAIFTNERGEVTEGGRSSIFALIDGQWKTPALRCGVLPGVMRSKMLGDPAWNAQEAVLYPDDIKRADRLVLVNALRGVIEVDRSTLGPFAF